MISISIVSHGQSGLLRDLFSDLARIYSKSQFEVILTKNIPEEMSVDIKESPFPIRIIENVEPKGFSENHNFAFRYANGEYFCVINPDIRILKNPFSALLSTLDDNKVGVVAPVIIAPNGTVEDSARHFPTPLAIIAKLLGISDGRYSVPEGSHGYAVDWVAGMFLLFRVASYRDVDGFDEGFFLYYEDVDICVRLWKKGYQVMVNSEVSVMHDARRSSHTNIVYIIWHIKSMIRYFARYWLRLPKVTK